MTRSADDPLIPLNCRMPTSLVVELRAKAQEAGCTVSDVLRSHLTLVDAKPLGKVRPRRGRPVALAPSSGADPTLLRGLAGIGNNVNQLARAVHAGALLGQPVEAVQVLAVLAALERSMAQLREAASC